jgi:cell wall-associated NlpC family hydrolase
MSVDAAISRISQIVAWQQGVMDPSTASATTATSATTSPASATSATSATAFSDALASAQGGLATGGLGATGLSSTGLGATGLSSTGLGATGLGATGLSTSGLGAAGLTTANPAGQVQAMTTMADSLLGKPYVWGGGHGSWAPSTGYDCSGFVSAVLHAGGYLSQPADTTSLPSQAGIASGPGQYVTIYDRAQPGENGHVIIDINGQFYESGGETGPWGGGGGVAKIGTPTAAYLATFPNVLHPQGL